MFSLVTFLYGISMRPFGENEMSWCSEIFHLAPGMYCGVCGLPFLLAFACDKFECRNSTLIPNLSNEI